MFRHILSHCMVVAVFMMAAGTALVAPTAMSAECLIDFEGFPSPYVMMPVIVVNCSQLTVTFSTTNPTVPHPNLGDWGGTVQGWLCNQNGGSDVTIPPYTAGLTWFLTWVECDPINYDMDVYFCPAVEKFEGYIFDIDNGWAEEEFIITAYDADGYVVPGPMSSMTVNRFAPAGGGDCGRQHWEVAGTGIKKVTFDGSKPTDNLGFGIDNLKVTYTPGQGCVTPPSGMVAWWPLGETSGSTANDIAGSVNNSGAWMNSPVPVSGKVAGALSFNGSNYVDVPNHPELNFGTGDLSIDAWIYPTNLSGIKPILDKRKDNVQAHGYTLFLSDGILAFQLAVDSRPISACGTGPTNACQNYSSATTVPIDDWTHVAVTVDRDDQSGGNFYVNGAYVRSFNPLTQAGNISNTGNLWIGRRQPTDVAPTAKYFNGSIDEVELFNRVLTPAEVQSIYEADCAGKCKQADIPTLTEWGLIIFGVVLLGFITWVFLKRRKAVAVKA